MVSSPIAVLDTGAGGLNVVAAIRRLLPREDIVYFADTAHLPYGTKSPQLIKYLTLKMAKKVIELSSCKILVIACHTMSVWCLEDLEKIVLVPVIGMVEPSIQGLKLLMTHKFLRTIGVLSTKATLHSGSYRKAWPSIDPEAKVTLIEHACGPLVSIVEEGNIDHHDLVFVLDHLLPETIKRCDALLIGCTHFSTLTSSLMKVLRPHCHIVDAADLVAEKVHMILENSRGFSSHGSAGQLIAYVSDNTERFANVARKFIEEECSVRLIEHYTIV
jgi:glutamate racemase